MNETLLISVCLIAAFATSFSVKFLTKILIEKDITDTPNERSNHTTKTPRGGGLSIIDTLLTGWFIGCFFIDGLFSYWLIMLCIACLAGLSWLDDVRNLSTKIRLAVHGSVIVVSTFVLFPDQLLFQGLLPAWIDKIVIIGAWIWFMNTFNFMDGIDGISGVEIISISSCLFLISLFLIEVNIPLFLLVLLIGSAIGFLHRNWHPASIFMGDVGSIPLGYLFGYMLLLVAFSHPIIALLPAAYYMADGGFTLLKRILKRERFWEAHSQHFYQQAVRGRLRHDQVVITIALINTCILGLIYFTLTDHLIAEYAFLTSYLLVIGCLLFFKRAGKTTT